MDSEYGLPTFRFVQRCLNEGIFKGVKSDKETPYPSPRIPANNASERFSFTSTLQQYDQVERA